MLRFRAEGFLSDIKMWYTEANVCLRDVNATDHHSPKFFDKNCEFVNGSYVTVTIEVNPYETIVEFFLDEILIGKTTFSAKKLGE